MSVNSEAAALRIDLRQAVILPGRVLAVDGDGELRQWIGGAWGGRWVRLVAIDAGTKERARLMRSKRAARQAYRRPSGGTTD